MKTGGRYSNKTKFDEAGNAELAKMREQRNTRVEVQSEGNCWKTFLFTLTNPHNIAARRFGKSVVFPNERFVGTGWKTHRLYPNDVLPFQSRDKQKSNVQWLEVWLLCVG
jgi:hypothetical protein